jgi:hypothetical protein
VPRKPGIALSWNSSLTRELFALDSPYGTMASQGEIMHKRDPFVIESWEVRSVQQELATMKARETGDITTAGIFENAAKETRNKVENYELHSYPTPDNRGAQRLDGMMIFYPSAGFGRATT